MFWLRKKKNNFQICTLIWRPDLMPVGLGDTKAKDKVTDGNSIFMHSIEIGP